MPFTQSTSSYQLHSSEYGNHSIVRALDGFLDAYERMNEVVMVPSLLKDMDVTVHFEKGTTSPACRRTAMKQMQKQGELVISNGRTEVSKVDLYSFYRMLQAVRQEVVIGGPSSANQSASYPAPPSSPDAQSSVDSGIGVAASLAESELDNMDNSSSSGASDASCDAQNDAQSEKLAALFRQHLQGLFTVLHQMTDAADFLAKRYQEDMSANLNS